MANEEDFPPVVPGIGSAPCWPRRRSGVVWWGGTMGAIAGGTQPESGSMVKVVVQQRKLTRDLISIFPDPSARARVADKRVSHKCVRFRAFFAVQNRTKLDKIVQKRAKRVQKQSERGGFSRPIFILVLNSFSI